MSNKPREKEEYLILAETRALQFIVQFPDQLAHFRPSMFVHSVAHTIYSALNYLDSMSMTIDAAAITQIANKVDERITLAVIKNLLFPDPTPAFVLADKELLVEDLMKAEARKQTLDLVSKAQEHLNTPTDGGDEYFSELSSLLTQASITAAQYKKSTSYTLAELFTEYEAELNERAKGTRFLSGDILLDKALVRKTAGGQIISIIGATGSGKSAYSLGLFDGFISIDEPAIFFTLEMDRISTADRLAARRIGAPLKDWYDVDKISNLKLKLKKEIESIGESRCEIIDDPTLSLSDINAVVAEFRQKHNISIEYRIPVFIDLITMVQDFARGPKGYSMAGSYEVAMNAANVLAKVQNACLIVTAQYNREVDNIHLESFSDLQKTRPHSINAIKNSHAIAERSRVVLSTWRPKYYAERYLPDAPELEQMDDIMEVSVLKQSQGEVGQRLNYLFEGDVMRITPTAEGALPTFGEDDMEEDEVDKDVLASVHF